MNLILAVDKIIDPSRTRITRENSCWTGGSSRECGSSVPQLSYTRIWVGGLECDKKKIEPAQIYLINFFNF